MRLYSERDLLISQFKKWIEECYAILWVNERWIQYDIISKPRVLDFILYFITEA